MGSNRSKNMAFLNFFGNFDFFKNGKADQNFLPTNFFYRPTGCIPKISMLYFEKLSHEN